MASEQSRRGFWREALALRGSVTARVVPSVLALGLLAAGMAGGDWLTQQAFHFRLALPFAPLEYAATGLGILLVIRMNAGYDRWWEARKLWGGIVNQSRNLAVGALAYGPRDPGWREQVVRWVAVLPHIARLGLRGERPGKEVETLVGRADADRIAAADHMSTYVSLRVGEFLREGRERGEVNPFALAHLDAERLRLLDHIGGCERILATPLPRIYSIQIRRFVLLFLLLLPLALLDRFAAGWPVPLITMAVAYPLLALDQMGVELENPFATTSLSYLPIDELSEAAARDLLAILAAERDATAGRSVGANDPSSPSMADPSPESTPGSG